MSELTKVVNTMFKLENNILDIVEKYFLYIVSGNSCGSNWCV